MFGAIAIIDDTGGRFISKGMGSGLEISLFAELLYSVKGRRNLFTGRMRPKKRITDQEALE